jgi:hypothetical protein
MQRSEAASPGRVDITASLNQSVDHAQVAVLRSPVQRGLVVARRAQLDLGAPFELRDHRRRVTSLRRLVQRIQLHPAPNTERALPPKPSSCRFEGPTCRPANHRSTEAAVPCARLWCVGWSGSPLVPFS